MSEFSDLVRVHWTGDPDTTTDKLMLELGLTDEQSAILGPVVRWGCRSVARRIVANAEDRAGVVEDRPRAAKFKTPRVGGGPGLEASNDGRLAYLQERFALPSGEYVLWGEATVPQLKARAEMLSKMRDGIGKTMEHIAAVIAQLTAAKAKCLNDLYGIKRDAA